MTANSYIGKRITQGIFLLLLAAVIAMSFLSYQQTFEFFKPGFPGQAIWAHLMSIVVQYGPTVCRVLAWDMRDSKQDTSGLLFAVAVVLEVFDAGTNVAWFIQYGGGPKWEVAQWYDVVRDLFVIVLLILVTQSEEMVGLLVSKILDFETEIRKILRLPVPEWMKWADNVAQGASARSGSAHSDHKPPPPNQPRQEVRDPDGLIRPMNMPPPNRPPQNNQQRPQNNQNRPPQRK